MADVSNVMLSWLLYALGESHKQRDINKEQNMLFNHD